MPGAGGLNGWRIEVTNLRQLMNALEVIDKSAAKNIQKKIGAVSKRVVVDATYISPSNNPLSGWGSWNTPNGNDTRNLSFDPAAVASGFKVQKSNFKRRGVSAGFGYDVQQWNAAGAIFEVMGEGNRVTNSSGQNMVDVVNKRFPRKQPRTLIAAYYRNMSEEVRNEIRDQIVEEARKAGLM
jgi:hypothetical protein